MAGKIDPNSIEVGKTEQLSMWTDGNWVNGPVHNDGQEIKQGRVRTHADGLGQDAKATSWQELYAWDSCLFQGLTTNVTLPIPVYVAEPGCKSISNCIFFPIPFPFSCSWTRSSLPAPSFFLPKRILSRLWSGLRLPCHMTFVKGRDVSASVSNQQLFSESLF